MPPAPWRRFCFTHPKTINSVHLVNLSFSWSFTAHYFLSSASFAVSKMPYRSHAMVTRSRGGATYQGMKMAVNAGRAISKAYQSYKRSRPSSGGHTLNKRRSTEPSGITTYQSDVRSTYRYKRAPRKLRTKWKKSRRQFTTNLLKTLASKKYHYSGNQLNSTAASAQNFFGFFTYGMNGNGGVDGSGDLEDLRLRLGASTVKDPNVTGDVSAVTKYFFDTMAGRCNLTNGSGNLAYIEVYTCRCRKDVPIDFGTTFRQFINNATTAARQPLGASAASTTQQTSATATPNATTIGTTPFQYRWFCQRFKIQSVKRFQISPGNSISWEFKDTKNRCFVPDNQEQALLAKAGWTTLYLFRQWGASVNSSSTPVESATTVTFEVEKDYNVKVMSAQTPELNYVTYTNISSA